MSWIETTIITTHEGSELISDTLLALGAEGIYTEDPYEFDTLTDDGFGIIKPSKESMYTSTDVIIKAYLDASLYDLNECVAMVEEALQQLKEGIDLDFGPLAVTVSIADESHWNDWEAQYPPISITDRLTIIPDWLDYHPKEGEEVIRIEPGLAFGTGDHPTTKLALQHVAPLIQPHSILFDVGTGSGIIALGAAKLGAHHVYAYDLDENAVHNALHHVTMNQLTLKVTVQQNNLLQGISQKASIIVANIITPILLTLIADAHRCLDPKGYFILSGIQEGEQGELMEALTKEGFHLIRETIQEGWVALVCQKL